MTAVQIRDSHPLRHPVPRNLKTAPSSNVPLQITSRIPKVPDFKFELLPLHSQLLRQSLLVSFPPLIDMLKFSGYPYLIRGQSEIIIGGWWAEHHTLKRREAFLPYNVEARAVIRHSISEERTFCQSSSPNTKQISLSVSLMTLEQACLVECHEAQCAFKDSMIH
jgi:hypothetical protein